MSFSIGIDMIEIDRIKQSIDRYGIRFLNKIFTGNEQEYCLRYKECERHFAGRFAAKEACVKALGTGINDQISWKDIEILNGPTGKPIVILNKFLKSILDSESLEISITHCKLYASAVAVKVPN